MNQPELTFNKKTVFVDVGCRQNPGPFEIQGVDEKGKQLFYYDFCLGSNNIGEYLAIYYAFRYHNSDTVYTDSKTAISWTRKGCRTTVPVDNETQEWIEMADAYFLNKGCDIRKWDTASLGEIPADFGRKIPSGKKLS